MRKVWLTLIASLVAMALGFWCGKLYVRHISIGPGDHFRYLNYVSVTLLGLACMSFVAVSGYVSREFRPTAAVVAGSALLIATFVVGKILTDIVNVHDWTFDLLLIPIILFVCGCVLLPVGTARALLSKFRQPPAGR